MNTTRPTATARRSVRTIATDALRPFPFSLELYGDPDAETDGLLESIRAQGVLVPLVVAHAEDGLGWEVLSGHRRLACARAIGLAEVPCQVRNLPSGADRRLAVLDYNRQRSKTFSQRMREADALETLLAEAARGRRLANLKRGPAAEPLSDGVETTAGRMSEFRRSERSHRRGGRAGHRPGRQGPLPPGPRRLAGRP